MTRRPAPVRTLRQARAFVLQAGRCGIFSDDRGRMPCLWHAVDLPGRRAGEKGWGPKITVIWTWENELPALYPDEIFYGKIPAAWPSCSAWTTCATGITRPTTARCASAARSRKKIHGLLRHDPLTTAQVREELGMTRRPERSLCDRALQELPTTLNIARWNRLEDTRDAWVPFTEQYLHLARPR